MAERLAPVRLTLLMAASLLSLVACDRPTRPDSQALPQEPDGRPRKSSTQAATLARVAPYAVPTDSIESAHCPSGMVFVQGDYCPRVRHTCLFYLDPPGRYHEFRCQRYGAPRCLSERRHLTFCIDRDEYAEEGDALPANYKSFTDAERLCRAAGKRVCRESEWNFACEGEQMRAYPYGFERDADICNADHTDILDDKGRLRDKRVPADTYPGCVSPFKVRNMAGNLEEFVARDGTRPVLPAMKGAYWQPGRNSCRAAQTAHDRYYNGVETGFRCCADAEPTDKVRRR